MTYSIIAHDPSTGELGAAVQSHFFAVGGSVPWVEAGVGAVATQAFVDVSYGPRGLGLMRAGRPPREALDALLGEDGGRDVRQVAMLDATGEPAVHTGSRCVHACGHATGDGVSAQGNMLISNEAWTEMVRSYEGTDGDMAERLLAALDAAEATGGDARGRQSAAILIVGGSRVDPPWQGRRLDCRVDDHPDPLRELRRLVALSQLYASMREMTAHEGLMVGEATASDDVLEGALGRLEEGERLLGANQEATMWRGILLARFGREDEARVAFADALDRRPELDGYLRGLSAAHFFPDPTVLERVLPRASRPRR